MITYFLNAVFLNVLLICPLLSASESTTPSRDGWSNGESCFILEQRSAAAPLVIRGLMPILGSTPFNPEISIKVDGEDVIRQRVAPGEFELRVISTANIGIHTVVIKFSELRELPAPDGRKIGGRLTFVGFETLQLASSLWIPENLRTDLLPIGSLVGIGGGWYPYESYNGEIFRWIGSDAQLAVIPGQQTILTLTAEPGPSLAGRLCELQLVDNKGHLIDKIQVPRKGSYDLIIPALAVEVQPLHLKVNGPVISVPGDGRILSLRVLAISARQ